MTQALTDQYDVAISSFWGLEAAQIIWNDIRVYPGMGGEYGNQSLIPHAKNYLGGNERDGLVVSLMDVWVLDARMVRLGY